MSEPLYYILYVSQANKPLGDDELASLLDVSRRNNIRDGITGLLIYKLWKNEKRANFLQLLEGPREAVENAYRKITNDDRHHTVIGLEKGPIDERSFSDWAMGLRNLQAGELKAFPGFREINEDSFDPDNFAAQLQIQPALESMKLFYENDD